MKYIVENNIGVNPPSNDIVYANSSSENNVYENEAYLRKQYERSNLAVIFVSDHFDVPIKEIMCKTRSSAIIAFARQIAIYIAHTTLSISYKDAALFFSRDRTTIAHACRTIEDRRDDQAFDAKIATVENLVQEAAEFIRRPIVNQYKDIETLPLVGGF